MSIYKDYIGSNSVHIFLEGGGGKNLFEAMTFVLHPCGYALAKLGENPDEH